MWMNFRGVVSKNLQMTPSRYFALRLHLKVIVEIAGNIAREVPKDDL